MDNERLPKRVMFGEVDRGKGYSGGKEQDWMGCFERDLSLFNLPTDVKHRTLAAKKPSEWFRRVEEAAQRYMKRWFVTEKKQAAKRRALEVQTAQQSKASLKPRPGEGRKRSHAEGAEATAARLGRSKKVKEAAEAWHRPSFQLRLPVTAACCCVTISVLCLLFFPVP